MSRNTIKNQADLEFAQKIVEGDQGAWGEFVERFTDWVFYKANAWTKRGKSGDHEPKRRLKNKTTGQEYAYSEAAVDAYLWIFQQLRNKLASYKGQSGASLSTYVWGLLNSKFLLIDYLRWRPDTLPKALRKGSEVEKGVYFLLNLQNCTACLHRLGQLQKASHARKSLAPTPAEVMEKAKYLQPAPEILKERAKQMRPGREPLRQKVGRFVEGVISRLKPTPVWATGLVAASAILLFFLLTPKSPLQNLAEDGELQFFTPGPFGFSQPSQTTPYQGMRVEISDDGERLIFTWPEIQDAFFYEITLTIAGNRQKITPPIGVTDKRFEISIDQIQKGKTYRWEISGQTEDKRVFSAKAGFVFHAATD